MHASFWHCSKSVWFLFTDFIAFMHWNASCSTACTRLAPATSSVSPVSTFAFGEEIASVVSFTRALTSAGVAASTRFA